MHLMEDVLRLYLELMDTHKKTPDEVRVLVVLGDPSPIGRDSGGAFQVDASKLHKIRLQQKIEMFHLWVS